MSTVNTQEHLSPKNVGWLNDKYARDHDMVNEVLRGPRVLTARISDIAETIISQDLPGRDNYVIAEFFAGTGPISKELSCRLLDVYNSNPKKNRLDGLHFIMADVRSDNPIENSVVLNQMVAAGAQVNYVTNTDHSDSAALSKALIDLTPMGRFHLMIATNGVYTLGTANSPQEKMTPAETENRVLNFLTTAYDLLHVGGKFIMCELFLAPESTNIFKALSTFRRREQLFTEETMEQGILPKKIRAYMSIVSRMMPILKTLGQNKRLLDRTTLLELPTFIDLCNRAKFTVEILEEPTYYKANSTLILTKAD